MMNEELIIPLCVAGAITALGVFVSRLFAGEADTKLRERLSVAPQTGEPDARSRASRHRGRASRAERVMRALEQIGAAAAEPFMPSSREKQSSLRRELGFAGIYSPLAMRLVTGAKVILMAGGIALGYLAGAMVGQALLGLSLGGLIGYVAPRAWLRQRVKANQLALGLALPDALDLMVVCVEAGLTVDAAMQRVGHELVRAHPGLARELGICHMETRIGLSRPEALRNLGIRTGNAGLQSMAAMLVQAERFGTSIANALRLQAEALRTRRQHAAEEMAAKASVKLSFPLVLFIFPATFIVLAGPTVIGLMQSPLFSE